MADVIDHQFWKLLFPLHSETLQGAQARTETLENLVNRHFVSLASTRYLKTCMVNAALHWPEIRLAALYVALRSPRDLTVSSNQVSFLSPPPPPLHLSQVSGHLQTGHRDAVHSLCQCLPVWPHRGGPMFTVSLCSRRCQCFPPRIIVLPAVFCVCDFYIFRICCAQQPNSLCWFHRYLINFLLDATLGMLVIYGGVKAVSAVVEWRQWDSLRFGEYGMTLNINCLE